MITIGSARSDERKKYSGGVAGDQRQTTTPDKSGEVSMQDFYIHPKGWYILRAKDDFIGSQLAHAMKTACNNKKIGYSQSDRYGIIKAGVKTSKKVNCDCSSLVRACILYASSIDVGDFNTSTEASVLEKSGLFYSRIKYTPTTPLSNGDILVSCTKGHTVIVVSGARRRLKDGD